MTIQVTWREYWTLRNSLDATSGNSILAAMDNEFKRIDLNGWLKSQPLVVVAEVIEYAPTAVMLAYLPLLPLKLASKVQKCRPPSEWQQMNEVFFHGRSVRL